MKETLTEKYRPKEWNEITGQEVIVEKLSKYVESGYIPHLILHGIRGTGKTTCARIIVDKLKARVLELNASDERGIEVVRSRIKGFMENLGPEGEARVIILEEADQMTKTAQEALRAMMEGNENNCRIIFLGNHAERIIKQIQDRCVVYEFKPIKKDSLVSFLQRVSDSEGIIITRQALNSIAEQSGGSARKCLRLLEDLAILDRKITLEDVKESYDNIAEHFGDLYSFIKRKDLLGAINISHRYFKDTGIDMRKYLEIFEAYLISSGDFKGVWLSNIADADIRISMGGTDQVQIDGLLARMCA